MLIRLETMVKRRSPPFLRRQHRGLCCPIPPWLQSISMPSPGQSQRGKAGELPLLAVHCWASSDNRAAHEVSLPVPYPDLCPGSILLTLMLITLPSSRAVLNHVEVVHECTQISVPPTATPRRSQGGRRKSHIFEKTYESYAPAVLRASRPPTEAVAAQLLAPSHWKARGRAHRVN